MSMDVRARRMSAAIGLVLAGLTSSALYAGEGKEQPNDGRKGENTAADQRRAGETLSERLDRNDSVLHPPAGVDPGIAVAVPDPTPNTTPVIPPPGTPGGDRSVKPQ